MNINRNNYEEFFLLYVDNELSAAERNAVELFVQENVDLQEELNMLLQTVMNADAVSFDNKNSLLKEEFTVLQENLLLYIDDELSADEKLNTEKLLQADYSALKELGLLQQTKLQQETIVFADKKSLYRKEKGRVIDLPWRRIAAAAVLIGFGTWATVSFMKTNKTGTEGVETANEIKTVTPKQIDNTVTPVLEQPTIPSTNSTTASTDLIKQPAQKSNPAVVNKEQQNVPQQKNTNIAVVEKDIKKPNNNLPKSYLENINNEERNKTLIARVTPIDNATDKIYSGNKIDVAESNYKSNTGGEVNGYALRANFTEGDAGTDLSPEDDKGKKTKLGGFFRKVKRLVDRNTNVTNGNGIKVAGFDIAIK